MRYDIFNPTKAGRVIYDGIVGKQRKITVLPGETKLDVELADHIAAGFNYAPCDDESDLVLSPLGSAVNEGPQPLPADYKRYEAPPIEPVFVTNTPRRESAEQDAARTTPRRRRKAQADLIGD
jgi:hypothetical protein